MARRYVDYIIPKKSNSLGEMLEIGSILGFSHFWIDHNLVKRSDQLNLPSNQVEIIPRLDIDQPEIKKDKITAILRQQRRKIPIIAIKCHDPEITSWAAQDNRIDIINFPLHQIGRLFTRSVAKLMIKFHKNLEISLVNLYSIPERQQIPILRHLQQALTIAVLKQVPLIFNSGSTTKFHLKTPLDLAALAQFLLPRQINTLDTISKIPSRLIHKNIVKTSEDYISPGVYTKKGIQQIREIDTALEEEEE